MRVWRLDLEYEGTRYAGWQSQPHARTVQGELQRAAEQLLGARAEVGGSGRTDSGVHALRQVAHLKSKSAGRAPDPVQLKAGLNKLLPHDVNVLRVAQARTDFHARHDAVRRYYLYQIATRRTAFGKSFVWWVRDRLDARAMQAACATLAGRRDFASFCESPSEQRSTLVEVERAELRAEGGLLLFRIGASHFLWKMVRRLVGALVEVGRGSLSAEGFGALLERYSNEPAAWTAPPSGLFLERVVYEGEPPPGALRAAFPLTAE
ncbi:MAG TPA: tRNA pseudouridine(38-40) synthase TruA [Pyrinomonadaceae bacterium]